MLRRWGVPAIAGLDTRRLARRLRETGSQRVVITAPGEVDAAAAVDAARRVMRWEDQDFVSQVSADAAHEIGPTGGPIVALVDYGLKENIVRQLLERGARVRVLPHTVTPEAALAPPAGRVMVEIMSLDILAIAAHPDDVEQTCGGALIRMAEVGYRTGVLDLTAGDMGTRGTPEHRICESEEAARLLLLRWRGNLHFPDARLENNIAARMTLAMKIRELKPRVVILPYWEARHPDHYRAGELGYEACFLAGLKKLDPQSEPHRPFKVIYASLYANVTPSFVVDISAQFERRMAALLAYRSQYGAAGEGSGLFPDEMEIRDRLGSVARFYGNLIGVRYGEPFVVKETMRVDDIVTMGVRSL
jgi:bacillithiol biosynthesis deacetylase BshB1